MAEDSHHSVIDIDPEVKVEEKSKNGPKKRLHLNPAKAVIGGITHSTNAVIGGISQSTNVVKGGISQMENGLTNVGGKLTKVPGVSHGVSIFADYRKFLDRGNVVDLAVAVVIGAAFTGIVDSLVKDIVSPIMSLASGKALEENFVILRKDSAFVNPDYSTRAAVKASNALSWNYGNFIQTVINFFIISACVFVIVKLYQMGRNTKTDAAPPEKKCPYCAGSIEATAFRCPKCTSWLDLEMYANLEDQKARRLNDGGNGNQYEAETWNEKSGLEEQDIVVSSFEPDGRNHFEQ
ncbi:large conductance mechanosensitive channel [Entomortierella parvispora]|uniref:Large conductance mechanosensitive channel n=1 Tax=Entomortierella parvispora TaxID=205924 RepID=A0A9P3HDG5_9FUNG|nr:large conductance mechanosensitive channel [Entomortierella parvispora]